MEIEENKSEKTEEIIEKRKESVKKFLKNTFWIYYIILAIIVWLSYHIRTRNLPGLKDITTNTWTLGPDLDPFLFLRWAEYIVEHGKLMVIDTMRYVPLGFNTGQETKLLSYLIAYLYDFLHIFSKQATVTYAAVIFPAVMFALTVIAFFFLTRKIFWETFDNKNFPNIIALIACFFLSVLPSILPRTIAGIPEKESAGFLFIFLSLYFFICSLKSKNYKHSIIHGILAGIFTSCLGAIWGGVTFIFMTIGLSAFVLFIFGQMHKKELTGYISWIITFMAILITMAPGRNPLISFFTSTSTIPIFISLFLILFHIYAYPKIHHIKIINAIKTKWHLPPEIISVICVIILMIIISIFVLGPNFVINLSKEVIGQMIHPFSQDRFSLTVAENRQPYFSEWGSEFGPMIGNIPIFFWLFFFGAVALFYGLLKNINKKEKWILTILYLIFLFGLIFSRYSPTSRLNGENTLSLFVYFGAMALFVIGCIYTYYKYHKENKQELMKFDIGVIILFVLFFVTILAARGGVRLIMMLDPPTSIIVAYFIAICIKDINKSKDELLKIVAWVVVAIILVASLYAGVNLYKTNVSQASSFVPNIYTWQWQKAMSWVRNNTSESAVFGHWWDYGYWIQSIGKRATVLDGGNAVVWWNYNMAREVLTATEDNEGLIYLYTHNTTHYLIDSSDIGKYSAYSSIGGDINHDRISYIPSFFRDEKQTTETQNSTIYIYPVGAGLDEDIIWESNGKKEVFAKANSGIGAIILRENSNKEFAQPEAVIISQGKQFYVPLKSAYYNGQLHSYNIGIDAGIFLMDKLAQQGNNIYKTENGAGFYLSKRTVHSFLARKYLYGEEINFKLVHNEPNYITDNLRAQGLVVGDFAYLDGNFLGPIKIWEIKYPANIKTNPEKYMSLDYPDQTLRYS